MDIPPHVKLDHAPATVLNWAGESLGPASLSLVQQPEAAGRITSMLGEGHSVEQAVLVEVKDAALTDRDVENEFYGFIQPIALRLAHKQLRAFPKLQHHLDNQDVANSMTRSLVPGLRSFEFVSVDHLVSQLALRIRHKLLDYHRLYSAQKRGEALRSSTPVEDLRDSLATSAGDDPRQRAQDAETQALLVEEIAKLPDSERRVLQCDLQGLSQDQIAKELGTSKDAVRMARKRAMDRLSRKRPGLFGDGAGSERR